MPSNVDDDMAAQFLVSILIPPRNNAQGAGIDADVSLSPMYDGEHGCHQPMHADRLHQD